MTYRFAFVFLALACLLAGCGSGDGGASDWAKPSVITPVSNLEGRILPPVITSGASLQILPSTVEGTKVFIEDKPEYSAYTDSLGSFLIRNVPAGKYRIVAELMMGTSAYRQRSDLVHITGEFETQTLNTPVQLVSAPHRVRMQLLDLQTKSPVIGARLLLWGRQTIVDSNGDAELGPMPGGVWPVRVEANGYRTASFLVSFNSNRSAKLFASLTPLTAVDSNQAPLVEIQKNFETIRAGSSGSFTASGFDPDGDRIAYLWSASRGTFSQNSGINTVYYAPDTAGAVEIALTGTDDKGASARAVMNFDVLTGSSIPDNPNNRPPYAATDPIPANLTENLGTDVVLRWTGADPDGDNLTYDVLVATLGADLRVIAADITENRYRLTGLKVNQTYYWQIISRDIYSAISPGPQVWQFKTGDQDNSSPHLPANPSPADMSVDHGDSVVFSWTGGDPDPGDTVTYRLHLGTDSQDLAQLTSTNQTSFLHHGLDLGRTYYWRVIASDNRGKETQGPLWQFSTYTPPNRNPENPVAVMPASGSTNVAVDVQLQWSANDPDGDELTYDVFLGKNIPLAKIADNISAPSLFPPQNLDYSSRYYWQVVVRDDGGLTNPQSSVWSFTTAAQANRAPHVPVAINPANNATQVPLRPVFAWEGGDPDGDAVVYDFYLDTAIPPANLRAAGLTNERWTPSVDLEEGAKYYWKVVARDPAGLETSSDVFSFFVLAGADDTVTSVLSITPEDGSEFLPQNTEVRIVFNKPVNPATVEAATSFLPAVNGAWTWENDSTVVFWPQTPWPLGSHYKLHIAANTVRDSNNNNPMTEAVTSIFTFDSPIPLVPNHRSTGFPISVAAGQKVEVSVPELAAGANSYALVVAETSQTNFDVRASMVQDSSMHSCTAFRMFERQLADRPFPSNMTDGSLRASLNVMATQSVGDVNSFYIPAYGSVATTTAFPDNLIRARCFRATDQTYIYVDESVVNPSDELVGEFRRRFEEGILPKMRDVFGNEPARGPDNDPRVTILLTDGLAPGILGIFYGVDLLGNDPGDVQLRESNGRKIMYLRYTVANDITRYGVVAHEFQHMINYWQKRTNAGSGVFEEVWLDEGLSKYAEEVCGYGILQGDQNTALLIQRSQDNMSFLSLTNWSGLNSYALSYLFVRFLAHENRYGTTYRDVTRSLVSSSRTGRANVEAVTRESFDYTLGRWGLCLYLNRHQANDPDEYGFYGLDLNGSYAGVNLNGFNIQTLTTGYSSVVGLPANGMRLFKKESAGSGYTSFELDGFTGRANLWLFDQRN